MEILSDRPTVAGDSDHPDTSRLNGLQTTGREYRNLSPAEYGMVRDVDEPVPLRGGGNLLCDVYRPDAARRFPVLIAARRIHARFRIWARRRRSSRRATASSSCRAGMFT
jgi:predicted acyl esterase